MENIKFIYLIGIASFSIAKDSSRYENIIQDELPIRHNKVYALPPREEKYIILPDVELRPNKNKDTLGREQLIRMYNKRRK